MNPSPTGRQCPMTIEQWKPCPAVPCYTWSLGPWSACQLHVSFKNYTSSCRHAYANNRIKFWIIRYTYVWTDYGRVRYCIETFENTKPFLSWRELRVDTAWPPGTYRACGLTMVKWSNPRSAVRWASKNRCHGKIVTYPAVPVVPCLNGARGRIVTETAKRKL